jgi:hypothetical protein
MSDLNKGAQGQESQQPTEDAGAAFEQELLSEQAPQQSQPTPTQQRQQQQRQFQVSHYLGQFDQQIRDTEGQIEELEAKQMDPDKHYLKDDGGFDGLAFNRDKVFLDKLNRTLMRLGRERSMASENAERWATYAQRKASDVLRGNMEKVPEHLRNTVRQVFTQGFKNLKQQGWFANADIQDAEQIQNALDQIFNSAVGYALRNAPAPSGDKAPPREQGLDDNSGDVASQKPGEDDGFGDDQLARDTYKQIMDPWRQRQSNKGKTLADVLREEREARKR